MEARGSGDQLHTFLTSSADGGDLLHAPATLPSGEYSPVHTEKMAGWAPRPGLTLSRRENILALLGNVVHGRQARSLSYWLIKKMIIPR